MQENFYKQEFKKLNEPQKEVVENINWPIMVVAGPWTGKTQIIGMRTANIIENAGVNPENILITTFTEAWVIAIKKRLSNFIWSEAYKVKVATIHSFAQDIITSYPEKFAEFKASITIDDIESLQVLTDIIDTNIKNNNIEYLFTAFDRYMYLRDIKDRIGKLKAEWISFAKFDKIISELRTEYDQKLEDLKSNKRIRDLEKRTKKDSENYKKHIWKLTELNFFYKIYQDYLKKNSLYDFSDMINFAVKKLEDDEDLKYDLAEKFQYIMLDEYQDTNNSQNKLIDLILSVWNSKNIMVVWDDDQSIYRFQGANIENMLDFVGTYPYTKFIVLKNNYRSAQSILDLSTDLIENNSGRLVNKLPDLKKELIAQRDYKDLNNNKYFILQDEILEKLFILEDIKKKSSHSISTPGHSLLSFQDNSPCPKGIDWEQEHFAIICRSNREVEEWTKFMQLQNIEVESKLKTNILKNKFVEFILDFLEIIENPESSDEKLFDILRTDIIDIENIDVISLAKILYKKNYSKSWFKANLWSLLKNIDSDFLEKNNILDVEKKAIFELDLENVFKNFTKILEFRDLILELNSELGLYWISRLFQKLLEKIWLIEYIETNGTFSDLEDIFTLFNKIKTLNENNNDLSLKELLNKFELHNKYKIWISRQILKKTNSNIEILTAHSSKWLEYDYVYIPWVYSWNWESKRVIDKLKLPLWIAWNWLQFSGLDEKELKNVEKETQLQEDRRLFFVAMTRAKKELIFTRPAGKENKPYIDSPFILEAWFSGELVENKIENNSVLETIKKELLWKWEDLVKTIKEEINYISEFLENYKLSPTDLNTFLEDPKKFLKNVVFKYPFTGNEFTIFGNVYHKVLELATMTKISPNSVSLKGIEVATLWEMTEKFLELIKYQILTSEERDRLTKKWLEWLTWYYEIFSKNPRIPLAVEYNFRSRDVVFEWVRITGKIDKVEKINNPLSTLSGGINNGEQSPLFIEDVAVVDYKTWGIKTEWKIKWVDRYWNKKESFEEGKYYRQLLFYKLLSENDREFSSKYNVVELALDFVEWKNWEYKYVWIIPENDDYEEFKILVKDSWEKINSLEFWKKILN